MLDVINKLLKTKSLLTSPSTVSPLHLKQTFLPIIWNFAEGEGDGIESRLPFKSFLLYTPTLNSLYCKPQNTTDILLLLNIPPAVYGFCPTLPSLVICNQMPNFQRIPTNEFKYLDALHLKSDFTRKIWVSFGNRKYFTMESMP